MTLNYIQQLTVINTNTMTKEVMIGMLSQGANGNEILQILEVLVANSNTPQPTLQELQF